MADRETLLERLIPGDLERQIPAAVQKALPGGFRNRIVQAGLGLLISFGLAFLVRRWIEQREARRRALQPMPKPRVLPQAEPEVRAAVAAAMAGPEPPPETSAPATPAPEGGATRYPLLARPHIMLSGTLDQAMYASFREQLAAAPHDGSLVVALSTPGGDPEVARLIGDDIRLLREHAGRDTLFLGKVAVHSAGAIVMAAFPADKRFLTRGTRLMIRERTLDRTVTASGPLRNCVATLEAALHEIEESMRIEEEGLRDLLAGSRVSLDQVRERAPASWYIEAEEARALGLVLDVI